eukprot:SAG11_NODE_1953_length_4008_cov_5.134561_1_plen_80_part_00
MDPIAAAKHQSCPTYSLSTPLTPQRLLRSIVCAALIAYPFLSHVPFPCLTMMSLSSTTAHAATVSCHYMLSAIMLSSLR